MPRHIGTTPILGARLRECFELVEAYGKAPEEIFSPIDALKYLSSRALFSQSMKDQWTQVVNPPNISHTFWYRQLQDF
jgi:uncharacterized protein (DUF1810 family)